MVERDVGTVHRYLGGAAVQVEKRLGKQGSGYSQLLGFRVLGGLWRKSGEPQRLG